MKVENAIKLRQAQALHQQGRVGEAEGLYREILGREPDSPEVIYWLGVVALQSGNFKNAVGLFQRVLEFEQRNPDVFANLALALDQTGRFEEAIAAYSQALALRPGALTILINRAATLNALGGFAQSKADCDQVLKAQPGHPAALTNRGMALLGLGQPEEALKDLDQALAVEPGNLQALNNRGNALGALGRLDEALAAFDHALAVDPRDAMALNNRGGVLRDLDRLTEALESYDKALAIRPDDVDTLMNKVSVQCLLGRRADAVVTMGRVLMLRPNQAGPLSERGALLGDLKRFDEAIAHYGKALDLEPDSPEVLSRRATLYSEIRKHDEAIQDLERVREINPDQPLSMGALRYAKLSVCDWRDFDVLTSTIIDKVRSGIPVDQPLSFLSTSQSPADQLQCARQYLVTTCSPQEPLWKGEIYNHDKIRIAYLSADLREHVVGTMMVGLFEQHDRERFEVTAISLCREEETELRARMKGAFDHFVDANEMTDKAVAQLIREREIDILVDLQGYTGGCRTGVMAYRAAPVQVQYLGYPGTLGAPFYDYIIADRHVLPDEHRPFYAEHVVRLPDTYLINSSSPVVDDQPLTRAQVGLPDEGFVFCSFNTNYKFNPPFFDMWMRLLNQVEGSVLWVRHPSETAYQNMIREAEARGVDRSRIITATHLPLPVHMARHRLADLFLDTLPYNAHSTASDALWAGLPMLTCRGGAFAGRVGASQLLAVGLPELITESMEDYEALALKLATTPELLAEYRKRLADARETSPLYQVDRYRRHIESAFETMYARAQAGEPATDFDVSPIAS